MLIKLPTVCKTIDETTYRRTKQINYNTANNLTPQALNKKDRKCLYKKKPSGLRVRNSLNAAAEPENLYLSKPEIEKLIREKENQWKNLLKN
jgi:excinuclease ABC subunit B